MFEVPLNPDDVEFEIMSNMLSISFGVSSILEILLESYIIIPLLFSLDKFSVPLIVVEVAFNVPENDPPDAYMLPLNTPSVAYTFPLKTPADALTIPENVAFPEPTIFPEESIVKVFSLFVF